MNKTRNGKNALCRRFIPIFLSAVFAGAMNLAAVAGAQVEEPSLHPLSWEVMEEENVPPRNILATETGEALVYELDRDFSRLKFGAMRALYFSSEYSNPLREYDGLLPEDIYPDDYEAFKDWLESNLADAILEALEHHPKVVRMVNTVISSFNPGVATKDLEEKEYEFSRLEEAAALQVREAKRTMKVARVNGPTKKLFGEDYQMLSRFVWLDINDGFQDIVRWETRLLNVEFFGKDVLSLDEIRIDLTYDSAAIKILKARPFGLPILATTFAKYEDGEAKWGLIFTLEKRDIARAARLLEERRRGKKVRIPLKNKFDIGVVGHEGGEWAVGFVYRGMI